MAPAPLPTENLEAYNYYLRAEQLTYRAEPASAADALYEKAIALHLEFAHAYGGLARVAADVLPYGREPRPSTPARPKKI